MTDKKPTKPVTLADYIPSEPEPPVRPKLRRVSEQDRDRLDALDRSIRVEDSASKSPRKKTKPKSNKWTLVFYIVALIILLILID